MSRKTFFVGVVVIALTFGIMVTGCASSSSSSSGSARASTGPVSFNGFWELPHGQIYYFYENVFLRFNSNGGVEQIGVLKHTASQFFFILDEDSEAIFNYTFASGNIRASNDAANTWANGIWKKRNDIEMNDSDNPFVGYWECKTENQISILYISLGGWGNQFRCDTDYNITGAIGEITYEDDDPSVFKMTLMGKGFSMSLPPSKGIIDGEALLFGVGDDVSKYQRYIKK